ncbi:unnamed protein product [Protopolystoma xenopodis]|uniref:Uncharacterized protein n=1 Tax=Protopolystoma xenopodis TaxID=117903 RepID=A0A3S5CN44_9PLAT|nr:unnamed protein product [Protopolystoma xenopodis]
MLDYFDPLINISSTNPGNNADPVLVKEAPTSDTLDFNSQSLSLSGTEAALPTSIEPHLLCTGKEDNKMEEPSALAYGTLARGVCGESNWPETRNHSATSSGQFTMSTLPTIRSTTKPVEYSAKSDCQTDARPIKPSEVSAELDGGVTRRPTNQASLQSCSPRSLCLSKLIPSALGDKQISTTSNRPLLHTKQATYIPASSESSGSGSPNRHRKNRSSQLNIDSSHHTLVQNESIAGMKSKENCSFQVHN